MIRNSRVYSCELGEEHKILAEMAEAKGWPIITIHEHTNMSYYPDEGYCPDFSGEYEFDTKKLIEDPNKWRDFGSLSYVSFILEAALAGHKETTASRKYSFGDTPDWWVDYEPGADDTADRTRMFIDVDVNY
jgi:hypothetical protein